MNVHELMEKIEEKRLAVGMSTRALGREIGISFSTIARYYRGEGYPHAASQAMLGAWLKGEKENKNIRERKNEMNKLEMRVQTLERMLGVSP